MEGVILKTLSCSVYSLNDEPDANVGNNHGLELTVEDLQSNSVSPSKVASCTPDLMMTDMNESSYLSHVSDHFSPAGGFSARHMSGVGSLRSDARTAVLPYSSKGLGVATKSFNGPVQAQPGQSSQPFGSRAFAVTGAAGVADTDVRRCLTSLMWHAVVMTDLGGGGGVESVRILRAYCPLLHVDGRGSLINLGVLVFINSQSHPNKPSRHYSATMYNSVNQSKTGVRSKRFVPSEGIVSSKIPVYASDDGARMGNSIHEQNVQIKSQLLELFEFMWNCKDTGPMHKVERSFQDDSLRGVSFLATVTALARWLWRTRNYSTANGLEGSGVSPFIPVVSSLMQELQQCHSDLTSHVSSSSFQTDELQHQLADLRWKLDAQVSQEESLLDSNKQLQVRLSELQQVCIFTFSMMWNAVLIVLNC